MISVLVQITNYFGLLVIRFGGFVTPLSTQLSLSRCRSRQERHPGQSNAQCPPLEIQYSYQMGWNVASLQKRDKRPAIMLNRHQSLKIWPDCWFVNLLFHSVWRRRCCGLSEKKWQMNTCVCPSSSQSCLKMRLKWWKDQRMEREAKKSVVGYKWLDFSIWQINRKVIFPLKLAGQRCPPTDCVANVSSRPCWCQADPKSGPRWPIRR